MRSGYMMQEGAIVSRPGSVSGEAGKNLSFLPGSGNAAGNSAGGSLLLKPGTGNGTGAQGVVQVLPTKSTSGGTTALQFMGINSTSFVGFKAPDTVTTNTVWTLPMLDGTANQVLQTNGSGVLSWNSPSVPNVFVNIAGNSGTAVADAVADTLTISGSIGIQTVASDASNADVLTINLSRTGLTLKATPIAADQFLMFDSANSNAPVYATASTVASAIGALSAARIVRATFVNAGLSAGSLTITHNLGVSNVLVQVYDDSQQLVQPDNITLTSNNVTTIDLSSFTVAGTWSYVVFG
jgi:hypothetical protein